MIKHKDYLEKYEEQEERARQAVRLINLSVSAKFRDNTYLGATDPHAVMEKIKKLCHVDGEDRARELAYNAIDSLHCSDCKHATAFISKLIRYQNEIKDLKGEYSDNQLIAKICRSLPIQYSYYVHVWRKLSTAGFVKRDIESLRKHVFEADYEFNHRRGLYDKARERIHNYDDGRGDVSKKGRIAKQPSKASLR